MRSDEQVLSALMPKSSRGYAEGLRMYDAMKEKSGEESVTASKKLQSLNMAKSLGKGIGMDMPAELKSAGVPSQSQQVKNIQGRAVYNNGSTWIDAYIRKKKYARTVQIRYASEAYFNLLKDKPKIAEFLALGRNVRFVFGDVLYEIGE
jgi:hypothetical protein